MTIKIIEADEVDIMMLAPLIQTYWEEAPQSAGTTLAIDKVMCELLMSTKRPHEVILLALEKGEVAGILWGSLEVELWSSELHSRERVFYVMPSHRGSFLSTRLIKEFYKWSESRGAKAVRFGAASGVDNNEPAKRLYQAMGMTLEGYTFIKR